ncbi:hypothetical protein NQ315_005488 [Exocentrus adspersus]|uniref:LIM zinc-binding domain-containing protein n=1 Tax=Exocentrus adspersus TaxID=1586481 RepID=A0AAV8VUP8_9CUCU|nr:hypothetical protein NQ315_005488 [Exocentrus adspersus]
MNPHYHPYGGPELTSPHPPSPDNGAYHGHPGPGGPHGRMHPTNGHAIGTLGKKFNSNISKEIDKSKQKKNLWGVNVSSPSSLFFFSVKGQFNILDSKDGHPNGPHDQHPHNHHQHPAFTSAGPPSDGPHHPHHNPAITNNNNNNNNTVKICAGCGGKIVERFLLHALDRYWHNGCLKCSCCAAMLADIGTSCFTKAGMILCKQDYMR